MNWLTPLLLAGVLLMSVAIPGESRAATPAATPGAVPTADGDFAGLVDIGGRRLFLECRGTGGPTVILESGFGNNADVWDTVALPPDSAATAVFPAVAGFTRVCAYDRPGTMTDDEHLSRSDPVPQPRTAAAAVSDLHALLHAADVPGPYVLVGHSFGGLIVRLYAATYPDDVVGLVLVDPAHEDLYERFDALLTPEQQAAYHGLAATAPAGWPGPGSFEQHDLGATAAEVRAAVKRTPPGATPMVVLSHGKPIAIDTDPGTPAPSLPMDAFDRLLLELHRNLVAETPGAQLIVAAESAHYIQVDQPDMVIEAIRATVDDLRESSAKGTPTA